MNYRPVLPSSFANVDIPRGAAMNLADGNSQPVLVTGNDDEVGVVGRAAVRPRLPSPPPGGNGP